MIIFKEHTMKRFIIATAICCLTLSGMAQKERSGTPDTVRVGNFIIVKKDRVNSGPIQRHPEGTVKTNPHSGIISTNWLFMDLGFANLRDNTDYTAAQSTGYLKVLRPANGPVNQNSLALNGGKSSNVNIWFFMQRLNISHHVLNLKYGLGLEMYNFRYDKSPSYRSDPAPFIFNDSIGFSKDKLYAGYLTVPLMVNINTTPHHRDGFSFSFGASAGYLVGSHEKQISAERGKQKVYSDFNMQPWRVAGIMELGIGPVRLYGSYSFNALHRESTGLVQYPYAVGLRLSNW